MINEIYKGLGLGISALLGCLAIYLWRQKQLRDVKARMFDIEVLEKEAKETISKMDPDSLIAEANRFMGPKK